MTQPRSATFNGDGPEVPNGSRAESVPITTGDHPAAHIEQAQSEPAGTRTYTLAGRLVSLRLVWAAILRHRWLCLVFAVIGLLVGASFRLIVPPAYSAYTTVYVVHSPGTEDVVGIGNDMALLRTTDVVQRANRILGTHLTVDQLLGAAPAKAPSDNVMTITITGPSSREAVRRVNAVTEAFLAFRAAQYNAQEASLVAGLNSHITSLQGEVASLSNRIATTSPGSSSLAGITSQRDADATAITNLQQQVQQAQLGTLSVNQGTHLLTPGTPVHLSKAKVYLVDGLSGFGIGLMLAVTLVALQALLSDKVRRREDVAALLGAPVDFSMNRRSPLPRRRSSPTVIDQAAVARHFRSHLSLNRTRSTLLIVSFDDPTVAAGALTSLSGQLLAAGMPVVLVDLTAQRCLARLSTDPSGSNLRIPTGDGKAAPLLSPPPSVSVEEWCSAGAAHESLWDSEGVILGLATVDPALGAWHLGGWDRAIATVTAGKNSAQRVTTIAQLLRAAQVQLVSTVLLDADADDESVGLLPNPGHEEAAAPDAARNGTPSNQTQAPAHTPAHAPAAAPTPAATSAMPTGSS